MIHTVDFYIHEDDDPKEVFADIVDGNVPVGEYDKDEYKKFIGDPGAIIKMRIVVSMVPVYGD